MLKLFKRKENSLYDTRQILAWLWSAWQQHRLQALLNTLIGIAIVCVNLAFVWGTKLIIDIATHTENRLTIKQAAAFLITLIIIEISLSIASRWVKTLLGVKAQNKMQKHLFAHLLNSEWSGLKPFHSGDLINRTEKDVSSLVTFLTDELPSMITTVVQFVGAFLFLFYMNQTLAIIVAIILPLFILVSKLYLRRMRSLTHQVRDSESRIQSVLQESVQHRSVVKALSQNLVILERLSNIQQLLRRQVLTQTKLSTVTSTLMNVGFAAGYLTAFLWGVINLQSGLITYGSLMAFIQLVGQIQTPARNITRFIPKIISILTASERLMELYDIKPEAAGVPQHLHNAVGIKLNDVTYAYTSDGRLIFDRVSLNIPQGSRVAIIGETGVGKTTLIRLLLAFVKPVSGNVYLYDAQRQVEVSPQTRCNYAYVPQGNTLFSGTIADNLRMGNNAATEQQMTEALKAAHADFVLKMPEGLATRCGELGDGLSEGQAQRIAIARALLSNAGLLLLDEATSALDEKTEETVVKNIIGRQVAQTMLCVTHRPTIIKYCTHVVRLSRGKVTVEVRHEA